MQHRQKANPRAINHIGQVDPRAVDALAGVQAAGESSLAPGSAKQYASRQNQFYKWVDPLKLATGRTVTPQVTLWFIWDYVLLRPAKNIKASNQTPTTSNQKRTWDAANLPDPGNEEDERDPEEEDVGAELGPVDPLVIEKELDQSQRDLLGYLGAGQKGAHPLTQVDTLRDDALLRLINCRQSVSSIRQFVAAMVDLYTKQVNMGINNSSHPRDGPVKGLLLAIHKVNHARFWTTFQDRGKHTHLDGFKNKTQIARSFESYYVDNNKDGVRDAVSASIGMFGLLRGDNQRSMCFSELSMYNCEDKGPTHCPAVVVVTRQGKTNKDNRTQYAAFMRNKDVFICPVFFLAAYVFDKTHIGRITGARLAEGGGASNAEIARAGGWAQGVMENVYLSNLPQEAMRTLAGFRKDHGGFFLPRAVTVPPSLAREVFPMIEQWNTLCRSRPQGKRDMAAEGFLELLEILRTTFLQDSVHWRQKYPHHYLWRHSLFQSPAYIAFATYAATHTTMRTQQVAPEIAVVAPLLADVMTAQLGGLRAMMLEQAQRASNTHVDVRGLVREQEAMLATIKLIYQSLSEPRTIILPPYIAPPPDSMPQPASVPQHWLGSALTTQQTVPSTDTGLPLQVASTSAMSLQSIVTPFRMSRAVTTLVDLVQEYEYGLNGLPSVKSVYENGHKWGKDDQTERKFYSNRKVLLDFVYHFASLRNTERNHAARMWDAYCTEHRIGSLDKFIKMIKTSRDHLGQM